MIKNKRLDWTYPNGADQMNINPEVIDAVRS